MKSRKYSEPTGQLFHVGFDISNYKDILPDIDEYLKEDEIVNLYERDLDKCVWKVEEPKVLTIDYKKREIRRSLYTGCWMILKGMLIWIPPQYYFFLRFFRTGGDRPKFRLNRLMDVYAKIRTRKNPYAIGDFTIKSRQIGETTIEMSNCLFEAAKLDYGLIGIQSMTRKVVRQSCWRTLIMGWNALDKWVKDEIFAEFSSGDAVAETMNFVRQADTSSGGKNVQILYTAGTFDSVNNMRKVVFDEWLKWEEQSPFGTFLNYEKFVVNGTTRKGIFSIFSSPPDKETRYAEECYKFWQNSNPEELNENGTTKTGVFRHYTSPLTGIDGFYDIWGDADPNPIYDWIMAKRKSVPKEYRKGEIRAYPLNEAEMFESMDSSGFEWANREGIQARKIYLIGTKYKDEATKEPKVVYGNLEWRNGEMDTDVVFRQADSETFNEYDARFGFAYLPQNSEPLLSGLSYSKGLLIGERPKPPKYIENSLGIDPFAKRYRTGASDSKGAMVNHKFRDIYQTGINRCPTMLYIERPLHADTFHEDAIKAAIFNRALVQPESITDKIIDYFEDRGYMDWILPRIGHSNTSMQKGDAPTGGKNLLMGEIIGLIDALTNVPNPYDKESGGDYPLQRQWFYELLDSISTFNPKDTHKNDAMMAWGQALLGAVKIMRLKRKKIDSALTKEVLNFVVG